MSLPTLSFEQSVAALKKQTFPHHSNYYAMYSTWLGGITLDPQLMMVPMDDHIVHRGDGIFEAIKCTGNQIYLLDAHIDRLLRSAELIHLKLPVTRDALVDVICQTVRAGSHPDCLIRLFVSRGPGGFTTNPYESVGSQLYIVITRLGVPTADRYANGASLKTSSVPIKEGFFANVKSCNYLPNVLMKKEAVDAGVDFTVSLDERGFLGEGSTENFALITKDKRFLVPSFARTLRGTILLRTMALAQSLIAAGELKEVSEADLRVEQAYSAAELMLFGTTMDCLPVIRYDGHEIGGGVPGPLAKKFLALLREDQISGAGVRTSVL